MLIELMSCRGCQRVVDQFSFPIRCPRCGSGYFAAVNPSKWILVRWFLSNPKHVLRLVLKDLKERYVS